MINQSVPLKCSFQVNILDGAGETLVLLGIIVLKTNLDFNSLQKVTFLVFRSLDYSVNTLIECITRYFGPEIEIILSEREAWQVMSSAYHFPW